MLDEGLNTSFLSASWSQERDAAMKRAADAESAADRKKTEAESQATTMKHLEEEMAQLQKSLEAKHSKELEEALNEEEKLKQEVIQMKEQLSKLTRESEGKVKELRVSQLGNKPIVLPLVLLFHGSYTAHIFSSIVWALRRLSWRRQPRKTKWRRRGAMQRSWR